MTTESFGFKTLKLDVNSILLSSILLTTYQLRLDEFLNISSKPRKFSSDGLFSDLTNLAERLACCCLNFRTTCIVLWLKEKGIYS